MSRWLATLVAVAVSATGCARPIGTIATLHRLQYVSPPCRDAVTPGGGPPAAAVRWSGPQHAADLASLDAWCRATGPAVVDAVPVGGAPSAAADDVVVVTWNLHVGAADLDGFLRRLRAGEFTAGHLVSRYLLLLQEAHRGGDEVPVAPADGRGAKAIGAPGASRVDVVEFAARHGLALHYVPSMRNGRGAGARADRGNAIVSTEPLDDLAAIELPFERQRRVAVAAAIRLRDAAGVESRVRVASVHLDVAASARRLWMFGARTRQVQALLGALPAAGPVVVGGDFNTWFGFSDGAYRSMAAAIPDLAAADRRPTFAGFLRLDHLFSRLPPGWSATARRLDDRFGSDHYPIVARLRAPHRPDRLAAP
jgi:endonuclease/exonuclease/phosphatase family metal-dependent hydrolase